MRKNVKNKRAVPLDTAKKNLARLVREKREEAGLSRHSCVLASGVAYRTWSGIECANYNITLDTLINLMQVLDIKEINLDYLLQN